MQLGLLAKPTFHNAKTFNAHWGAGLYFRHPGLNIYGLADFDVAAALEKIHKAIVWIGPRCSIAFDRLRNIRIHASPQNCTNQILSGVWVVAPPNKFIKNHHPGSDHFLAYILRLQAVPSKSFRFPVPTANRPDHASGSSSHGTNRHASGTGNLLIASINGACGTLV